MSGLLFLTKSVLLASGGGVLLGTFSVVSARLSQVLGDQEGA